MSASERLKNGIISLPGSLKEAVHEFSLSEEMKAALGSHIASNIIKAKTQEYEDYSRDVSPWEIDKYFNCF